MTDDDKVLVYADHDPFVMLPESILYHPSLTDRAVRLWATLKRHAGPEGRICPSRARLGSLMSCSVDKIDRAKRELAKQGLLVVIYRYRCECGSEGQRCDELGHKQQQLVNHYRLVLPEVAANLRPPSRKTAATVAASPRPKREQENERTPHTPPLGGLEIDEAFLAWYSRYPRHENRGAAHRAWRKAIKKATVEEINSGLDRLLQWIATGEPKDRKFLPHPSTWLNGERWADELPAVDTRPEHGGDRSYVGPRDLTTCELCSDTKGLVETPQGWTKCKHEEAA